MDIDLSYTKENDLKKILFTLSQIKNEFYQKNNFALFVDKIPSKFISSKNVLFNKDLFEYVANQFDWEKLDFNYYSDLANDIKDPNLFKEFEPYLIDIRKHKIDINFLKDATKTILDFHEIKNCQVNIYFVSTGTPVSFRFVDNIINMFVRFDTNTSQIIPGISNAIVSNIYPKDYQTRQIINNFLFLNTNLKNLIVLKEYKRMYLEKDTFNLEASKISQENYRVLGFPLTQLARLNKNGVLESDLIKPKKLSQKEYLVLRKFVENEGVIVSFEEISYLLWGNIIDKKFSLEAISKIIERLRLKIKSDGVKREVIFTKRGRGYIFIN